MVLDWISLHISNFVAKSLLLKALNKLKNSISQSCLKLDITFCYYSIYHTKSFRQWYGAFRFSRCLPIKQFKGFKKKNTQVSEVIRVNILWQFFFVSLKPGIECHEAQRLNSWWLNSSPQNKRGLHTCILVQFHILLCLTHKFKTFIIIIPPEVR